MNRKNVQTCNICGNANMQYSFNLKHLQYYKCNVCNYLKRVPSDLQIDYANEYMSVEILSHSQRLANNYYRRFKNEIVENSNCLEFGGSFAFFSKLLKEQKNCMVRNVELSELAGKIAKQNGIDTSTSLDELDIKYDYIFSFHVFEHLPPNELHDTFNKLLTLLSDKGILFLLTPNANSFKIKLFKRYYPWLAPDEHISFLSNKSIKHLLQQCNDFEYSVSSAIPSFFHYPMISLTSILRKKFIKGKVSSIASTEKFVTQVSIKTRALNLLKSLFHIAVTIEKIIVFPIYLLIDAVFTDRDELVVKIQKKTNANIT
jgi:2-polyprenyl-3-methyl-5-hydroxy-6-metoxy-1,4-benzoquinol methylase